jgi:hypothetical protein
MQLLSFNVTFNTTNLWHLWLGHINKRRFEDPQSISKGVHTFDEIPSLRVNVVLKVDNVVHHFSRWELQGQSKYLGWFIQIFLDHYKPTHILVASNFFTFINDFSRYTFAYSIKHKYEMFVIFLQYKVFVECQTNHKIKVLRYDNASE